MTPDIQAHLQSWGCRVICRPQGPQVGPRPFMLRFHLHPAVKAEPAEQGRAAVLTTPGGESWLFEADGQEVRLEESIFFAVAEGPRRTLQIAPVKPVLRRGIERFHIARDIGGIHPFPPAAPGTGGQDQNGASDGGERQARQHAGAIAAVPMNAK